MFNSTDDFLNLYVDTDISIGDTGLSSRDEFSYSIFITRWLKGIGDRIPLYAPIAAHHRSGKFLFYRTKQSVFFLHDDGRVEVMPSYNCSNVGRVYTLATVGIKDRFAKVVLSGRDPKPIFDVFDNVSLSGPNLVKALDAMAKNTEPTYDIGDLLNTIADFNGGNWSDELFNVVLKYERDKLRELVSSRRFDLDAVSTYAQRFKIVNRKLQKLLAEVTELEENKNEQTEGCVS